MSVPPEISEIDPAGADPSFRAAPLPVRKASAWLTLHADEIRRRRWFALGNLGVFLAAFPLAVVVAAVSGSEPIGAAAMLVAFGVFGAGTWWTVKANAATAAAENLVTRWKTLQDLGVAADLTVDTETAVGGLDRMVGRIEALAGPGPIRDAAVHALERARRLETERTHLAEIETGQPVADAALHAARERIETELSRIRARVAEAYACLVEKEAGAADDDLDDALVRLSAELEVDRDAKQRARAARAAKVVG